MYLLLYSYILQNIYIFYYIFILNNMFIIYIYMLFLYIPGWKQYKQTSLQKRGWGEKKMKGFPAAFHFRIELTWTMQKKTRFGLPVGGFKYF